MTKLYVFLNYDNNISIYNFLKFIFGFYFAFSKIYTIYKTNLDLEGQFVWYPNLNFINIFGFESG